MNVTPYTDVITVCLITFLDTLPFSPSATSSSTGSVSFSICAITSLRIAV